MVNYCVCVCSVMPCFWCSGRHFPTKLFKYWIKWPFYVIFFNAICMYARVSAGAAIVQCFCYVVCGVLKCKHNYLMYFQNVNCGIWG